MTQLLGDAQRSQPPVGECSGLWLPTVDGLGPGFRSLRMNEFTSLGSSEENCANRGTFLFMSIAD